MGFSVNAPSIYPNATFPESRFTDLETDVANVVGDLADKADATTVAASGLGFVNHGATAGVARPTAYFAVMWLGSVEPTNAANGDVWIDTT